MSAQRGKRNDQNYRQITGMIRKQLAVKFKAECVYLDQDMGSVLQEIVEQWVEKEGEYGDATVTDEFLSLLVRSERPDDGLIRDVARHLHEDVEALLHIVERVLRDTP